MPSSSAEEDASYVEYERLSVVSGLEKSSVIC